MVGLLLMQKNKEIRYIGWENTNVWQKKETTRSTTFILQKAAKKKGGRKRASITVQPGSNSGRLYSMCQSLTTSPQCPPCFLKNRRWTHDYQKNSFSLFSQNPDYKLYFFFSWEWSSWYDASFRFIWKLYLYFSSLYRQNKKTTL